MADRSVAGNAGELLVLGELLRRGVVGALTPRNHRHYDILAVKGSRALSVRVKTKTNASTWLWRQQKDGSIFGDIGRSDFAVMVDLPVDGSAPQYYIAPTRRLDQYLREAFDLWAATPSKSGLPKNLDNWERRFGHTAKHQRAMARWRDNWPLLQRALGIKGDES